MRLTFKVRISLHAACKGIRMLIITQDLKQQKFVIEAEPSELVRPSTVIFPIRNPFSHPISRQVNDHLLT
jgi:hypothetical protein